MILYYLVPMMRMSLGEINATLIIAKQHFIVEALYYTRYSFGIHSPMHSLMLLWQAIALIP